MTNTTDQQRIAELPELPAADLLMPLHGKPSVRLYDDESTQAYAIAAQDKYAAPLVERIKELEQSLKQANMREAADYAELLDAMGEVKAQNVKLLNRAAELEKRNELMRLCIGEAKLALDGVQTVADNSKGIAGWHLNGDIAGWDELLPEVGVALHAFEQLDAALASSQQQKGGA